MKNFSAGDVYFKVYFVDEKLLYPFVHAYVFIGMNVQGDEDQDRWYFQDCESYARYGSFLSDTDDPREILALGSTSIADVFNLEELYRELSGAGARRSETF